MISAKNISNWINKPQTLSNSELAVLKFSAREFPYFLPIQYLAWFKQTNDKVSFFNLNEIFPANVVLLHSFFNSSLKEEDNEPLIKIEKKTIEFEDFYAAPIDYFSKQGVAVGHDLPIIEELSGKEKQEGTIAIEEKEKSLMVVMSFSEWLNYLQTKTQKEREEKEGQKALKAMWQKQKIAEALEEENEEIPDAVFEMAVNSILPEEELISESLANVYAMQGKKDKAIEMFKKLSLRNPEKNGYFAQKIKNLQKDYKI